MALKKVDFKQILLDKGERIGLFAGLGVMGLLVVGFGLGSALSEGPQKKVSNLEGLRKQAQTAYDQSQPDDGLDKLPPDLNVEALKPINPELYAAKWAFFQSLSTEDRKWRQPAVLGPDEFQVDLVRGEVQIYIINEDAKKNLTIGVLKTKTVSDLTADQRKEREEFNKKFPGVAQKLARRRPRQPVVLPTVPGAPGFPGAQSRIPGAPGALPAPGAGRPGDSRTGFQSPGLLGLQGVNRAATQEQELKMVPLDKMSEENGTLAQTSYPIRVIQISAAFPYRAQLEEFRKALRFNSVDDLFYDREGATPEFTGYSIQRRVYDPNGKAVGDWVDLDYETPLKQLRIRTREIEPEDPVLEADGMIVRPNRLVMPRPRLFGPPREYKWPEARLAGLERTKDEMEKALKENAPPPPKVKSRLEGIDLFDEGQTTQQGPGGEAMTPEGRQGRFPIAPPAGGKAPGPGVGRRELPGEGPGTVQKPAVFPEKILVRFLDVTVQPGYSYEYRIKIRMANPNYDHPERAVSNRLTKDKEIEGNWIPVKWTRNGQEQTRFHVSDELLYYAMQNEAQGAEGGSKKPATANKDQAVVQIHRWLENVRTKPGEQSNELPVGDWSILKERVVHRGEYVGKWADVEVPAWLISEDRYGLAVHPDEQKKVRRGNRLVMRYSKHKTIPLDFATDPVYGGKALVVDFEGGERTITMDGKPKKINGPVEMLIYTADGKLVVHNSQRDTADSERQKRFQEWDQWLTAVKNQADNPTHGGPGDLFTPRSKGKAPGGG